MSGRISYFFHAFFLSLTAFCASAALAHGSGQGTNRCRTEVVSTTVAGPDRYHETYASIVKTNLTIQNFTIRTEDGKTVNVNTDPITVDMQTLNKIFQGLKVDLTNAEFPGGSETIAVAEIESLIVQAPGELVFSGDANCALSIGSRKINFYTAAPITVGHDAYNVKVNFTPLDSVQLNLVTKVKRTTCCAHSHDCRDRSRDKCVNSEQTSEVRTCRFVNRRQPITAIVRQVDDQP